MLVAVPGGLVSLLSWRENAASTGCGVRGTSFAVVANVPPDVEYYQDNHDEDNHNIQAVENGGQGAKMIAQHVSGVGEQ